MESASSVGITAPQLSQNRFSRETSAPHRGQFNAKEVPQLAQNLARSRFSNSHTEHRILQLPGLANRLFFRRMRYKPDFTR
jgi:hypothetical protein